MMSSGFSGGTVLSSWPAMSCTHFRFFPCSAVCHSLPVTSDAPLLAVPSLRSDETTCTLSSLCPVVIGWATDSWSGFVAKERRAVRPGSKPAGSSTSEERVIGPPVVGLKDISFAGSWAHSSQASRGRGTGVAC